MSREDDPLRVPVTDKQLALLELVKLQSGGHSDQEEGMCAMEALAFIAGVPHSDRPACCSPSLTSAMQRLNDSADSDEQRQRLKELLPQVLNTAPRNPREERLEQERTARLNNLDYRSEGWNERFRLVKEAIDQKAA
jgi:hypothetical protein